MKIPWYENPDYEAALTDDGVKPGTTQVTPLTVKEDFGVYSVSKLCEFWDLCGISRSQQFVWIAQIDKAFEDEMRAIREQEEGL